MPIIWLIIPSIIIVSMQTISTVRLTAPTITLSMLTLILPGITLYSMCHFGYLVTIEVHHYVLLAT